MIAVDGKAVRGAKNKEGKAPHLVAALAHGIGAILGQVAVDAKPNETPAVRDLQPPTGTTPATRSERSSYFRQHERLCRVPAPALDFRTP